MGEKWSEAPSIGREKFRTESWKLLHSKWFATGGNDWISDVFFFFFFWTSDFPRSRLAVAFPEYIPTTEVKSYWRWIFHDLIARNLSW